MHCFRGGFDKIIPVLFIAKRLFQESTTGEYPRLERRPILFIKPAFS